MKTEPCVLVKVHDGDSVSITVAGAKLSLRLDQIDAPELRQDHGKKAAKALAATLKGRLLAVERGGFDKYGRLIGTLWGDHGENINLELVRNGDAWAYVRYVRDPAFTQAQQEAAAAKRGLWQYKRKPTAPWIWRQKHNIGEVHHAENAGA